MIRKLLRRLILWAVSDSEPVMLNVEYGRHRCNVTVTGARDGNDRNIVLGDDPYARSVLDTIKRADLNRER